MTRGEFLKISWDKYIKPIILGTLLVYAINFFIEAIKSEGTERNILFAVIIGSILIIVILLLNLTSILFLEWLGSKMPNSLKYAFQKSNKVLRVLSPFVSVWLIYELYIRNNNVGVAVTIWYLIQELRQYKKSESQKSI